VRSLHVHMLPLRILHLDDHLVAIDKPAGMIVHPGRDEEDAEWVAMKRVRDELGQQVYVLHRLDRPTSGVLLFARDKATCALVQQCFERRQVEKTYLAVVDGITAPSWCCETPLRKSPEEPPLSARTDFARLQVADAGSFPGNSQLGISLVKARPFTGRYHQIRRHLQEEGYPIVGDYRYAGKDRSDELGALLGTGTRMLLQAKVLELRHPCTGEPLRIEAPDDPDFLRCFPEYSGEAVAVP
jgi:tRNA pseudouridine65 synthase